MDRSIHYIGSMSRGAEKYNLMQFPAANTKMEYILKVLKNNGYYVKGVSTAGTLNRKFTWVPFLRTKIGLLEEAIQLPSIGSKYKLIRAINILLLWISLLVYSIFNIHKNDQVLIYHSLSYASPFLIMKRLKKFELILEVEEIYQDVSKCSKRVKVNEYRIFKAADKYLFSTELLNEKLNPTHKPYSIIYGTYEVEKDRKCKFTDGKIHAVYAGNFDPRKGVLTAIAAAEYLDHNYHIHVVGFGTQMQKEEMIDFMMQISKKTACTITYDGLLGGEHYIRFLQSCDIGFSTQTPDAAYKDTSFPSKVLSYLSNGLRVVSIRIKVLERSGIGDMIFFYENNSPEDIAYTVKQVNMKNAYDSRSRIVELDKQFINKFIRLLEVT